MRILGIFRGFPGLGRVVAGVSLLEELRDQYGANIRMISYLQGNEYLKSKGYADLHEATPMDYCSIGLVPTNKMGAYIHTTIKEYTPDLILIDGEPLIVHSIKLSFPRMKIAVLLNPSDVDNSYNDKEAMDYFNSLYSMADVAIVHGLRKIRKPLFYDYKQFYSLNTILRREILKLKNIPSKDIYCILGGGTVNVSCQFTESSIRIGELCIKVAEELSEYRMHIVCSSANIYDALYRMSITDNVFLYKDIISPQYYYAHASLIITRSGRNTLSEIKYLDIPAITFVTGDRYRVVEQRQNVNLLHDDCCLMAESNWTKDELVRLIKRLNIPKESDKIGSFIPGNAIAMEILLNNTSSMPTK